MDFEERRINENGNSVSFLWGIDKIRGLVQTSQSENETKTPCP